MTDITEQADEQAIQQEVRRHINRPLLLQELAQNALTVAENLRDNYFRNTAKFIVNLKKRVYTEAAEEPIIKTERVDTLRWQEVKGERVAFIDGGMGNVELANQAPILLRVGSYTVLPSEADMGKREEFNYYPVLLGDIQGGSKERRDFSDIVRIVAELLGGLAVLERHKDLAVLMFHGPLMYQMGQYAGHAPFTEKDIDRFLENYASGVEDADSLKEDFLREASEEIYPKMGEGAARVWSEKRLFEPLALMSFLYQRLLKIAELRNPVPIIVGVVERGNSRGFAREVVMGRVFDGLKKKGNENYFNEMFGRKDLNSAERLIDRLGYSDTLLMAMLLEIGDRAEEWEMKKTQQLRQGTEIKLSVDFGEKDVVNFRSLQERFPRISGFYIHVSEVVEPIRVEVFSHLNQTSAAAKRAYLYSRLLPQYGFPVGLDIADKHAKVPAWLTSAYGKLIRGHLGVSLQRGDISDKEMRKIILQAICVSKRDWLFRPKI